jgi:hypothetical protein
LLFSAWRQTNRLRIICPEWAVVACGASNPLDLVEGSLLLLLVEDPILLLFIGSLARNQSKHHTFVQRWENYFLSGNQSFRLNNFCKNAMEKFCKTTKLSFLHSHICHIIDWFSCFRKFTINLKVQTRAVVRRTIYFLCFQSGVAGFITTFFKLEVYDTADNLGFKFRKRFVKAITFPANCKTLVPFTHAHVFRAIV